VTARSSATSTRPGSGTRRVTRVVVVAVAALAAGIGGVADANTGATAVPLRSQYETSTRSVSRDIGISVELTAGHDLWLFGDTLTYKRVGNHWTGAQFIDGGTAVEAKPRRGQVPQGREFPHASPSRFLPVPNDVYLPDGSGRRCTTRTAAYPARWITGAAVLPSNRSQLLITYAESCIQHASGGGATITTEGWGFVLYNWRTRRIAHGPDDVFAPSKSGNAISSTNVFVAPVFDKGRLTLFSSQCDAPDGTCAVGQVWFVTMPATIAAMGNTASYQTQLLPLALPATWAPMSIAVNRYPAGWRLIQLTSIWGTYKVFSASSATGPWQLLHSGTLPGCPTHTGLCWSPQGHPELSTKTQLYISYSKPDAGPGGHIVISAIPA
jgi:hypothetical protein